MTVGPQPRLRWLPLALILALLAGIALPRVHGNPHLLGAFAGVGGVLLVGWCALLLRARASGRPLLVETVPPVRTHYVQACVQLVLYAYWGWFWVDADGTRPIFAQAPLIVLQACYLYAFDALFAWVRGRPWRLASGPLPIVLSTNLFIWFRDDWFVWQFAMITVGLLGKAFIHWMREGRRTHVFNPSAFGLMVAALALIATHSVDLTWARPLATTIDAVPQIFVVLFGLGLVVQGFFRVTLMTFAAAVAMVAANLVYTGITGVYLFGSTNLPGAAFLGLMLLMTDPSTSPRSNVGRTLFGLGYGLGYVVFYELLGRIGAPELFAKLFPVPLLNLSVQVLDRLAQRGPLARLEARWQAAASPAKANVVHMALWSAVFATLLATGFVQNDAHPGNSIAFWKRALAEGKPSAGRKLVMVTGGKTIGREPGPAFNELGVIASEGKVTPADPKSAAHWFAMALAHGDADAAANIAVLFLFRRMRANDQDVARAFDLLEQRSYGGDLGVGTFLVGFAYETGQGRPQDRARALACYRRNWQQNLYSAKGLARLALARDGGAIDLTGVADVLRRGADQDDSECLWYLAYMHGTGRGAALDGPAAHACLERGCKLGSKQQCDVLRRGGLPAYVDPVPMLVPGWSSAFPVADAASR